MEHLESLRHFVSEMVNDLSGEIAEDEIFGFVYGGQKFTGRIYENFNGRLVVAFEAEVCTTGLTRSKQEIINRINGQLPFTTFKVTKTADAQHVVTATHALPVASLSADQLTQVLDSMAYQVVEQRKKFERANEIAKRVQEHMRNRPRIDRSTVRQRVQNSDSIDDDIDATDNDESSAQRARTPRISTSSALTSEILADLRRLVGLEPVKVEVERLVAAREFSRAREASGLPPIEQSPHLVFTGNPGTGKTTVARLVADLYKSLGILKKGHVVEADCSKLIAAYIGQTPIKTQRLCEEARGGVLFIDEAYGLTAHQHQGYGPEAIETLLKFMEDNRGDIVVIVAGYPKEMQGFLDANPGLRSRFDVVIDFPDYSTEELTSIFDLYLEQFQLELSPEAREKVITYTAGMERRRGFGNGRAMRNLFNEVMRRHAVWAGRNGTIIEDDLRLIGADVIPKPGDSVSAPETGGHRGVYL